MERKRNNQQKTKNKGRQWKTKINLGWEDEGEKEIESQRMDSHGKGKTGSAKEDPSTLALDPCYPLPSRRGATRQTVSVNRGISTPQPQPSSPALEEGKIERKREKWRLYEHPSLCSNFIPHFLLSFSLLPSLAPNPSFPSFAHRSLFVFVFC